MKSCWYGQWITLFLGWVSLARVNHQAVWYNAPMESFFNSLKTECVHRCHFKTRKQAKAALFDYIEIFYNRQRLHSTIGYKTPMEAYLEMTMKAA